MLPDPSSAESIDGVQQYASLLHIKPKPSNSLQHEAIIHSNHKKSPYTDASPQQPAHKSYNLRPSSVNPSLPSKKTALKLIHTTIRRIPPIHRSQNLQPKSLLKYKTLANDPFAPPPAKLGNCVPGPHPTP